MTTTGNSSRLRGLISSAANAATSDDEDFDSILSTTRRCFRPNQVVSRGRRALPYFTRKTFLLRRANSDYFPIKGECDHLTKVGMGYSREVSKYFLHWTLEQIQNYVCSLYPDIPLDLVGFQIGRMDRSKKLTMLINLNGAEDLKQQLIQSQVIIIPNRDLPLRAATEPNQAAVSAPSRTSIQDRHTRQVSSSVSTTPSMNAVNSVTNRRVDPIQVIANPREVPTTANPTSDNYVEMIDMDHFEDFQFEEHNDDNNNSVIDISFNVNANEIQEEILIEIDRNNAVNQLLEIYEDNSILQKTLKVHFKNEDGDDFGGLTKELFTIFWEGCKDKFFHGESLFVPHLELHRKNKDMKKFATLGKILTHMMILTKTIPNFIARSTYLLIGNPEFNVSKDTIKEDFLYFLTYGERELLKKAESSYDTLESYERTLLEEFFIANNFFDSPKKEEINDQIQTIADNIMISKPIDFIKAIKDGIPLIFENFWSSLTLDKLNKILIEQSPTPNKVIQCLKTDLDDLTLNQSSALYYLKTYIRNLKRGELSQFLYFVTGSSNMPQNINISFSNLSGACRRPIVHTCSNVLELPTTYTGFQDFSLEFNAILNNDISFQYTQV